MRLTKRNLEAMASGVLFGLGKRVLDIDILIEDSRWDSLGLEVLVDNAVRATFRHLNLDAASVEISLLACDDARIATLNADFRDRPTPTNVLSWPSEDLSAETPGEKPSLPEFGADGSVSLGDIAIAFDTCEREAADVNRPITAHVTHLIVHGTLHLLGYDHIRDPDAELMQGLETEILGKMGLDDPYYIQ